MTIEFIEALFKSTTEQDVHFCSLGNDRDAGFPRRQINTRDTDAILNFMRIWDQEGRGLYYCVGTLKPGTDRRKENVAEIAFLHSDIDFKDIDDTRQDVERKLRQLRYPPSIIVFSGNGIHAYWLLKEAMCGAADFDRVEAAYRLLADTVGGDPSVCEISRLMRVPGSHNTKNGAWTEVEVIEFNPDLRYELDEIEEMLSETAPKILRKKRPNQQPTAEDNPFLRAAAAMGFKPPIDVQERLSAMMYMGGGDSGIHKTQIEVGASLLNRGMPIDEVVPIILEATKAAAGPYGERWNWRREEASIRRDCESWLAKHPMKEKVQPKATGTDDTVVNFAEARKAKAEKQNAGKEKPAAKEKKDKVDVVAVVVEGLLAKLRADGRDILLTDGDVWIYEAGCWHIMTPNDDQGIQSDIVDGFTILGEHAKVGNYNAAYKYLTAHPKLYRRSVPWADGALVVCENGVLRLSDMSFEGHDPGHYARHKIGVPYVPGADCPMFVDLLQRMFRDKGEEAPGYISTIQNFAGAGLAVSRLNRESRKALLLAGASRTGKTELAGIISRVYGGQIASPSVAEISGRFGMTSFINARAWIRDDAINEGDKLDPQRFKTIVTGEAIEIERKNYDPIKVELAIPVLLTTNSLPRARDRSDAIFNRSLIIDMNNVVSPQEAIELRRQLGVPAGQSIGRFIFEREAAGILNWMLEGLHDLLARGDYEPPGSVLDALQRFKDDNNPVHEWTRSALKRADGGKVARHDLMCAYHGWQREQEGDEARAFGARAFFPRLKSAMPFIGQTTDAQGRRYVTGIHLTPEGLQSWHEHHMGPQLRGGNVGVSKEQREVNRGNSEARSHDKMSGEELF